MIRGTLYEKYAKEREACELIENESAFIFYRISAKECFIADMFVEKEKRKSGEAREIIKALKGIALANECELITGNIFLTDVNANQTLLAALHVGFKVVAANQSFLTIAMKAGG